MLVQQILSEKSQSGIIYVTPGTSVADAAQLMASKRIGTVLISADGETLLGILSERDIVHQIGRQGAQCLTQAVDDLMTRKVVSCRPEQRALEVLATMTEGKFRHMPVIRDDKLIGLISIGDAVKARLEELSMQKDALQGMIMGH